MSEEEETRKRSDSLGSLSSLSGSDSSQQLNSEEYQMSLRKTPESKLHPKFKNMDSSAYVRPPKRTYYEMLPEEKRAVVAEDLSISSDASTLNTEARKILLPDRSEKRYKDNIIKRRKILEEISRLKSENGDISDENKPSVSFNNSVLEKYFVVTDPYAKFEPTADPFSRERKLITISDDLSTYLADQLWNVKPELLEDKFLDLLVIVDDGTVPDKETSFLSKVSPINKSLKMSAAVDDTAGIFTIPNLKKLEENRLLDSTIKKTVNKINEKRSTICEKGRLFIESCTTQISDIAYKIWLSFMAVVGAVSESETGGRRTRRNKRNKQNKSKKSKQSSKRSKRRRTNKRRTHKK
jgi:hypothetical protein